MVIQVHNPSHLKVINYKNFQVPWTKEQLMDAFKNHDSDGDGKLSKEELRQAFNDLGSKLGIYRAKKALKCADNDNNGCIDIADSKELEDLVKYAYECGYKVPA